MTLYIDDDSIDDHLIALLARDGFTVVDPRAIGTLGIADPLHLAAAIERRAALLTKNRDDFADLHTLVRKANGAHHGIIVVRRKNDRIRDMKAAQIAAAMRKLSASGADVSNQLINLNHWR